MTAIEIGGRRGLIVRGRFYLLISVLMAAVIIGGFSSTVPDDFLGRPPLPLLLHIHGAVFTCWVLLFVAQPTLIANGSIALHRKLGLVGAGLAVAMVVMGVAATLYAIRFHMVPSFFPKGVFLVMNGVGILFFGALVAAGVALRRKPEWHKRLMLCATISILGPGLGRLLPMPAFGPAAPLVMFAVIEMFALAGPAMDLMVRRRIHPAYYWGVGAIVLSQAVIPVLAFAPPTVALLHLLQAG